MLVFNCPPTLFRSHTVPGQASVQSAKLPGAHLTIALLEPAEGRVAVEISSCRTKKIQTFDLYACVLVGNVFQRCADLMRNKLGSRLKKDIR